jgi:hypothetical protein
MIKGIIVNCWDGKTKRVGKKGILDGMRRI